MKIRDLIDELIRLETEATPDSEVTVMVHDIPGIEAVYGAHIEGTGWNEDGGLSINAVAP